MAAGKSCAGCAWKSLFAMKAIFIDIAVDKAGTPEQREALLALREVVAAYEAADAGFVERINVKATGMVAFLQRFPNAEVAGRA
jgi:hypothetical protein